MRTVCIVRALTCSVLLVLLFFSGGVASASEANVQRRERLRQLALDTIDVTQDPYFMKNHLGSYECKRQETYIQRYSNAISFLSSAHALIVALSLSQSVSHCIPTRVAISHTRRVRSINRIWLVVPRRCRRTKHSHLWKQRNASRLRKLSRSDGRDIR